MKYVIDANIKNGRPRLRVLDADTGRVHMEWSLTRISRMLDEGEIDPDDFLHPERYGMNLLLKNLFLLSCMENMTECRQNKNVPASVKTPQASSEDKSYRNTTQWNFVIKANPI